MIEDVEVPEGWRRVRLEEIIEIFDKERIPLDSEYRLTIKGRFPYCGATGVIDYINDYIFDGESVLIAEDGGRFNRFEETAYIMKGKFWANNHVHIVIGKRSVLNNLFLMYSINFQDISYYISGSTREKLNQQLLKSVYILFPASLSEQRKIAEILETVDNAIERTDTIIEKYKRVKQGLMRDLLTIGVVANDELGVMNYELRDGKKHRFKDYPPGRIPEEWEVVEIYEICNIINGGTPKTEKTEYWNGDIPWLSVEDFNTGKRWVVSSTKYITELGLKKSATRLLRKGMLIISARGSVGVIAQLGCDMAFNQTSYGLDSKDKSHITNDFLYYALKHYINSFLSLAYGNVFDTITRDTFKETKIPIPPLSEQHRIASVLSQMDQTIEKEQKYKQKLESIKQGLMEDLLTGKDRVNHLIKEGMENVQPA